MCNLIAHISVEENQIFTLTSYTTFASLKLCDMKTWNDHLMKCDNPHSSSQSLNWISQWPTYLHKARCATRSMQNRTDESKCFDELPLLMWQSDWLEDSENNEWGDPTASYRWTGWDWEINGWSSSTSGKLPTVLEESVEYTLNQ